MEVKVYDYAHGKAVSEREIEAYKKMAEQKYGGDIHALDIRVVSDDEVELTYHVKKPPFERVRRITGYLVGTLDKWNNAKRAEEHDRVKHGTEELD